MAVSASPLLQTRGNVLSGVAAFVLLLPLSRMLTQYANKYLSNDQWVAPALYLLIPLWLLLMGALLCVTASGGFDSLGFGRPLLYALTVAAAIALAGESFVSVAMYIRPGFTPRSLYVPLIYGVPLTTVLLVIVSLNATLAQRVPPASVRVPWMIMTAVSLVVGMSIAGQWAVRGGLRGVRSLAYRIGHRAPSADVVLAKFATLDPQRDFDELLRHAGAEERREVRDAVTAKLRADPQFIETLSTALNSRAASYALGFLHGATLSSEERRAWALPARNAIEQFTSEIPAPNYMPPDRRKQLLSWGRRTFPVIIEKFAGTDVDFSKIMPEFEHALRPDDTRR